MNALEDIQTQINGATMIIFCIGETLRKPVDVPSVLQYPKLLASIPINWAGIHYCYEDKVAAKMFPNPITLAQLAVDTMTRIKFRTHHGMSTDGRIWYLFCLIYSLVQSSKLLFRANLLFLFFF